MKKFELRQIGEYEFVGSIEDSRPDVHEIAMRIWLKKAMSSWMPTAMHRNFTILAQNGRL